jgi:Mg-chelatase subunit ChlD
MKTGYTYIALVCDRSGSMNAVRTDAEGAVNKFIEDQQAVPGEATLHLVDFDAPNTYGTTEAAWYNLIYKGDIKKAPKYVLQPRGNTALLDAVGMTIVAVGEQLAALSESQRPEHVVFVVQTDGQENSSKDWKIEALRERIKEQETQWQWQFVFLGMGPDTYAQGGAMGFSNVTRAKGTGASYAASYQNTSDTVSRLRSGAVSNLAGANVAVDDEGNVTSED